MVDTEGDYLSDTSHHLQGFAGAAHDAQADNLIARRLSSRVEKLQDVPVFGRLSAHVFNAPFSQATKKRLTRRPPLESPIQD